MTQTLQDFGVRKKKPVAWWKWGLFVALSGYAASWLPALMFYYHFQCLVAGYSPESPVGSLVHAPLMAFAQEKSAGRGDDGSGRWNQVGWHDSLLTLPPGDLQEVRQDRGTLVVLYRAGKADGPLKVLVDHFPPGFIRNLFFEEYRRLDGKVDQLPKAFVALGEGDLLEHIALARPENYRWGMGTDERMLYATRILAKMLLWDLERVESGVVLNGKNTKGVLMRGVGGEAKAILVCRGGVLVIGVPKGFPPAWLAEADMLLEILPASEPLLEIWRRGIKERFDSSHALYRWAFPPKGEAGEGRGAVEKGAVEEKEPAEKQEPAEKNGPEEEAVERGSLPPVGDAEGEGKDDGAEGGEKP